MGLPTAAFLFTTDRPYAPTAAAPRIDTSMLKRFTDSGVMPSIAPDFLSLPSELRLNADAES